METGLIAARAVHLAATISLGGIFAFLCFVARLDASPRLQRRLTALAWSSLALALLSGAAWLLFVAARMSGQALGSALGQGVVATVLARTLFGHIWALRFGLATIMACLLAVPARRRGNWWRFSGLTLGAALIATLAWAGHGGATPGRPGDLHLAADILHLLAAGAWVGALLPLALLLNELRRCGTPEAAAAAHRAAVRFSILAAVGVALLLAAGAVNTWFLAGGAPGLIGTAYGRLLLGKILLFVVMATVAAVNLLRLTPRLTLIDSAGRRAAAAFVHLRRNALIEAGLAVCVLVIVGILGILPPALHTEPGWPLPFRFQPGLLPVLSRGALALLATLAGALVAAAVATAAAGHYRAAIKSAGGFALCLGVGWIVLRPTLVPAYPTSFYAPAEPYAAPSVARGARLFAENCALCHGADGKGDGPAAAALSVRPADLTAPHLLSHTAGDLFWWVSQGKPSGAMPGFAPIMNAAQRWDVIDFIRARSAGALSRAIGAEAAESGGPALPDFAFVSDGQQQTLMEILQTGPALIALTSGNPLPARLAKLATAAGHAAAVPRVLAIDLDRGMRPQTRIPPPFVEIAPEVAATLGLFRSPDDGGETDLLIDPAGDVRARWTASGSGGLPDAATLIADATRATQSAAPSPAHTSHVH